MSQILADEEFTLRPTVADVRAAVGCDLSTWRKIVLFAIAGATFALVGQWLFVFCEDHLFQQTLLTPETERLKMVSFGCSVLLGAFAGVAVALSPTSWANCGRTVCIAGGGLVSGALSWWALFLINMAIEGGRIPAGIELAFQKFLSLEGLPFPTFLGLMLVVWAVWPRQK